jgi:predicted ATPase
MGKTRMLHELQSQVGDRALWLESRCLPYSSLFDPCADILLRWMQASETEPEVVVRTKARARLGSLFGPNLPELLPSFGRLLRLRLDTHSDGPATSAEGGAEAQRRAYAAWIEALAAEQPVVLALDDLDAADEATCGIAEALLKVTDTAAVLLAYTLRPGTHAPGAAVRMRTLDDFAHRTTELRLGPLAPDAARQLLDVLAPEGVGGRARAETLVRAEGNPLYLEELLKAQLKRGGGERHRTWTLTPQALRAMPPALEGLLLSRIDVLPQSARRLAQLAAAVGRDFPAAVLARLAPAVSIADDLAVLLRAEIIRERRRDPEREYTFKHGLFRDAALSTLTPRRRRDIYAAVARVYEELFAASLDQHAEVLAHYYAQSANDSKALEYLERAAEHSLALGATPEASLLWSKAHDLAARLDDSAAQERIARKL